MNHDFIALFPLIGSTHLDYYSFDHWPIIAWEDEDCSEDDRISGRQPKRFEDRSTKIEGSREIIEDVWRKRYYPNIKSFKQKLGQCISCLKRWDKDRLCGSLNGAITKKENEIRLLYQEGSWNWRRKTTKAERELELLLEKEERYWRAQARKDWLMWGDRNKKWFHHKASFRRRNNHIKGIMDECGR